MLDLAALENGGAVTGCSNMFYASPANLHRARRRPASMGEGWETARRRDDGNDWVEHRARRPRGRSCSPSWTPRCFVGNAPGLGALGGVAASRLGRELLPADPAAAGHPAPLPPRRRRPEVTHVRLDIYPDGGMARLRLWGRLSPAGREALVGAGTTPCPAASPGRCRPTGVRRRGCSRIARAAATGEGDDALDRSMGRQERPWSAPAVTVNGETVPLAGATPHTTALEWLRAQGLTGCKEGCAEGECGACSVLVARPGLGAATEWTAVNACLVPVAALDGQELVTAEGLGSPDALHPVQREMAVRGGSQCGYCTPGFVCSMAAEYYRADRAPDADGPGAGLERGPNGFDLHALSGNLCRCTGYRPIRDAAFALGPPPEDDALARRQDAPPPAVPATRLSADGSEFVRPAGLAEALALISRAPDAAVVAGSTDWGVEVNLRGARPALVVAVDRLPELRGFAVGDAAVEIGAGLSLTEVERRLEGGVPLLAEVFPQFASRLIRNGATFGGNLGTASPIGDTGARPPRPRRHRAPGLRRGRARGAAGRLLRRLPADGAPPRRADPRRPDPPSRRAASPPSSRSPSAASTTSPASPWASRSTSRTAS